MTPFTEPFSRDLTEFRPFGPTPPNPLRLVYTSWKPPKINRDVPVYLLGDCVDMGIWRLDSLISQRGGSAQIRVPYGDGVFKCQSMFQSLAIQFFPQIREPTYQQVKWGLQLMKQASLNETYNYHQEAVIFASDTRSTTQPSGKFLAVSRIEMTLTIDPTQPVAVT